MGADPEAAPFIVGVQRSGTTLLRLMLDAHPNLAIPPETHFVEEVARRRATCVSADSFWELLVRSERWPDFHLSAAELRKALKTAQPFTPSEALRCFYKLYARRFKKSRWGDKTPLYCLSMRAIQSLLPEAHFLHIIRDGRDAAVSERKTWWGAGEGDIRAQATFWRDTVTATRRDARSCLHYMELRYEDLVCAPSVTLKRVCEFLDLPYRAEMLRYHKMAPMRLRELGDLLRPEGTVVATRRERRSIHTLAHRPPDRTRIGCWRREMSHADQIAYQSVAGQLLQDLGYDAAS